MVPSGPTTDEPNRERPPRRKATRLPLVAIALLASCGYAVEETGNDIDERLQMIGEGQQTSFAELVDGGCDSVGLVGAYASNSARDETVGRAGVSMEGIDRFTLAVVFDESGERTRAVRLSRVPVDIDELATRRFSCTDEFVVTNGRASR